MADEPEATAGRPSIFSEEIAGIICERLELGESLRSICRDESMPGQATVHRWLNSTPQFREQYVRAREIQADTLADEMLEIADDGTNDWMEKFGRDGASIGWQINGEAVARSKLRLDQRKWYAAKLAPKKYGDRQQLDLSGGISVSVRAEDVADDELAAIAKGETK